MMPWHLETKVLKLYFFEVIAANPEITDVTVSQMFPYEVWSAVFVARVIWASSLRVYRQDMCPFRSYGFLSPQPSFSPQSSPYKPLFIILSEVDRLCFGAAYFLRMLKNKYNSFVLSEGVLTSSFAVCRF